MRANSPMPSIFDVFFEQMSRVPSLRSPQVSLQVVYPQNDELLSDYPDTAVQNYVFIDHVRPKLLQDKPCLGTPINLRSYPSTVKAPLFLLSYCLSSLAFSIPNPNPDYDLGCRNSVVQRIAHFFREWVRYSHVAESELPSVLRYQHYLCNSDVSKELRTFAAFGIIQAVLDQKNSVLFESVVTIFFVAIATGMGIGILQALGVPQLSALCLGLVFLAYASYVEIDQFLDESNRVECVKHIVSTSDLTTNDNQKDLKDLCEPHVMASVFRFFSSEFPLGSLPAGTQNNM